MAWSLSHQADIAREQGDVDTADTLYEQAREIFREQNMQLAVARCLVDLGGLAHQRRNPPAAQALFTQALTVFHELGETVEVARVLEELALCAVDRSSWRRALRLAAGASALRGKLGSLVPPSRMAGLESGLAIARDHMEPAAAARAWMEGFTLPMEDGIAYALGDCG